MGVEKFPFPCSFFFSLSLSLLYIFLIFVYPKSRIGFRHYIIHVADCPFSIIKNHSFSVSFFYINGSKYILVHPSFNSISVHTLFFLFFFFVILGLKCVWEWNYFYSFVRSNTFYACLPDARIARIESSAVVIIIKVQRRVMYYPTPLPCFRGKSEALFVVPSGASPGPPVLLRHARWSEPSRFSVYAPWSAVKPHYKHN